MKLRPLYDRVMIEREKEEPTKGNVVIIPDTAQQKPMQGRVVATGEGKLLDDGKLRALSVKIGDLVLIGKYAGTEVKINGKEYVVLREDDIMGVVEGQ